MRCRNHAALCMPALRRILYANIVGRNQRRHHRRCALRGLRRGSRRVRRARKGARTHSRSRTLARSCTCTLTRTQAHNSKRVQRPSTAEMWPNAFLQGRSKLLWRDIGTGACKCGGMHSSSRSAVSTRRGRGACAHTPARTHTRTHTHARARVHPWHVHRCAWTYRPVEEHARMHLRTARARTGAYGRTGRWRSTSRTKTSRSARRT
jgi:hypothetical protein